MVGFKKKNLTALALVAVLLASGIGAYHVNAAKQVDVTKTVTITANVDSTSAFATNYAKFNGKDDVVVDLYKIAEVKQSGEIGDSLIQGVDLSVLSQSKVTVDAVKEKIVTPAKEAIEGKKADETITVPMTGENKYTDSVEIEAGAGIYLYVPHDVKDDRYIYHFTPYVIMVPNSEYITSTGTIVSTNGNKVEVAVGQGSDDWQYEASFNLKAEPEHRYGYLGIHKKLDRFNESLGTASFIYKVEGKFDNEVIYTNYYAIDFKEAGEGIAPSGSKTIKLPAGSVVTVTEVYSGASYEQKAGGYYLAKKQEENEETTRAAQLVEAEPIIIADDTLIADFENDYDNELQVGGVSITNTYGLIDGEYHYINKVDEEVAR